MKYFSLLITCLLVTAYNSDGASRGEQWAAVEKAIEGGLPRTAITNLNPIIAGATREKAWAEAVKGITLKISLEGQIEGDKPEEKIVRLRQVLQQAPAETRPVLETVLAHWYWQYFQVNRWRFQERTQTGQPPGDDFTTWDLPRLLTEIDTTFQQALSHEDLLKSTPVSAWDALLTKGTMPDAARPTMYDFIAHQALEFYLAGEQGVTRPQKPFVLQADSPLLAAAEEFLEWRPDTGDPTQPALRAIQIFQSLLSFHREDAEPRIAYADADLARISWAGTSATGVSRKDRYRERLELFIRDHADLELASIASERLARVFQQDQDLVKAREIALKGSQLHPKSPGAALCRNLVKVIEARHLSVVTERVWNCGSRGPQTCSKIKVNYRNLDRIYLRAIKTDWSGDLLFALNYGNRSGVYRDLIGLKPSLEWQEVLPPTPNYQERSELRTAPTEKLEPGFYVLAASSNPDFSEKGEPVFLTQFWVSKLALAIRGKQGSVEGILTEADSGAPLPGAEIQLWRRDNNNRATLARTLKTDELGTFSTTLEPRGGWGILARHEDETIGSATQYFYGQEATSADTTTRTLIFTDRAIYRPGQQIHYKGVLGKITPGKSSYEVYPDQEVTLVFRDPNGKEIERQRKRSNVYGSFSGSFTAPANRLTGRMTIFDEQRPESGIAVSVEEYKRPKFEVTLPAPSEPARLNGEVKLEGLAMGYTGAAVDGATVAYRIVRNTQMPWWWWRGWSPGEAEEIANGITTTDLQGGFLVSFVARPDPAIPEGNEPTFDFTVFADVTDSAGETRSAQRSIRVGYTALEAFVSLEEWNTETEPVRLSVETKTLDGEPESADGKLVVYRLIEPAEMARADILGETQEPETSMADPRNWQTGAVATVQGFTTGTNGLAVVNLNLTRGMYLAELLTQDRFGKAVSARQVIRVLNPDSEHLGLKVPFLVAWPRSSVQPGEDFIVLWGTGYESGRALVQLEQDGVILERFWTDPARTQQLIKKQITESMRGGLSLHITQVRENRLYTHSQTIQVPWENKQFLVRWEHFVSKLRPGEPETWSLVVQPKQGAKFSNSGPLAEVAAVLYDASLDAFEEHGWAAVFPWFRQEATWSHIRFCNVPRNLNHLMGAWSMTHEAAEISYRDFPPPIMVFRGDRLRAFYSLGQQMPMALAPMPGAVNAPAEDASFAGVAAVADRLERDFKAKGGEVSPSKAPATDLSSITARKNLAETAFFYPHLVTDTNGAVTISFTMPEALTKWRFLGFAHDRQLRSGLLQDEAVTAKDLMVQPNPPRFLREGDEIEFVVKVSNQSERQQKGSVQLQFLDTLGVSNAVVNGLLGIKAANQEFSIPAKESRTYSWRLHVPEELSVLTYRAVAASDTVSDGEEGPIPVLSRRILVTESLAMPIRGPATRKFLFDKLLESGKSRTLKSQSYTVQVVSQPAWYAVLALPYLMEFPHECSEQVFNRYYANALARHIVSSDPRIQQVFEQWRNTPALDSPLEKNADLKSVTLEESPWLRQAQKESQARRNVGILFQENRLRAEQDNTLEKLSLAQLESGAWPWFPGGQGDSYITLYITAGFGRLRHLGVDVDISPALRSLDHLDHFMVERYNSIQKRPNPEEHIPAPVEALYLYARSFFLQDKPITPPVKPAVEFFLGQARKFWVKTGSRQTQGHLALGLKRFDLHEKKSDPTPMAILNSLMERSVVSEEMGRFWRDTELSWWWYRAPIETQALMVEAFAEVAEDARAVEDLKVWLLKQKQTQDWKTTKATADAVYALLLRGTSLLSSDALVELQVGGDNVTPGAKKAGDRRVTAPEAGTGFYEVRYQGREIVPKLGRLVLEKKDSGVAWASAHWQYLENVEKVTPHQGSPLKLTKALFVKQNTSSGPVLEPVQGPVGVGAELVTRVEIRVDRDMEYVHLKDYHGSGTEPVNVLSRYRYQDGLAYYESTRDTATHFFIDYLPKGTYVFEYSNRVQLRGSYQTGIAEIQCMYAPEFNSHSASVRLDVK